MQAYSLPRRRVFVDYWELTKPRITLLVLFTTLAGLWLAAQGPPPMGLLFFTLLGTGLASSSAGVLNNLLDRDLDAKMARTRGRPLPSGRLTPKAALAFGVSLGLAALAILGVFVHPVSAGLALLALSFYVGIYTAWLKRTSPLSTVLGGVTGALPPVIGWSAVTHRVDAGALVLFAVLFLWQPPHFWALALLRAEEYKEAGVPLLPVIYGPQMTQRQIALYAAALPPVSLLLYPLGLVDLSYVFVAAALGMGFVLLSVRALLAPQDGHRARGLFLYSIVYLGALSAAMLLGCGCFAP